MSAYVSVMSAGAGGIGIRAGSLIMPSCPGIYGFGGLAALIPGDLPLRPLPLHRNPQDRSGLTTPMPSRSGKTETVGTAWRGELRV